MNRRQRRAARFTVPPRSPQPQPLLDRGGIDQAALDRLLRLRALVRMDGDVVPLVVPLDDWRSPEWDHMGFDRETCLAGLVQFIRPVSPSEAALLPPGVAAGDWVMVSQVSPGLRSRMGVTLDFHEVS